MKSNTVLFVGGAIIAVLLWLDHSSKQVPPTPPDPVVVDFPEPEGVFASVPAASPYVNGQTAAELAWFWKNFATQIKTDTEIAHVDAVRNMHVYAGKTLRRLLGEKVYSEGLSNSFEDFFKRVVGHDNIPLDTQKRDQIVKAFMAIAWSCHEASGGAHFAQSDGVCDPLTGSCLTNNAELACYVAGLNLRNNPAFFQPGPMEPEQPEITDFPTDGLIVDEKEVQEFIQQIPDFKQFGFSGFEEGKTRLLYESLVKLDPGAFTERQTTGDCFIAWRNNMNLVGTKVRLADGSEKAIEDVVPGDWVLNAHNEPSEVVTSFKKPFSGKLYEVRLQGLVDPVVCTPDHLFLVSVGGEEKWVRAENLTKSDTVLVPFARVGAVKPRPVPMSEFGLELSIASVVTHDAKDIEVYCIEVPNHNSFVANGIAVHNCVSHSTRNAADSSRAFEIDVLHDDETFVTRGATEPIYGVRGHAGQGMTVVGSVKFVSENGGVLLRKKYGDFDLSVYNAEIGTSWGRNREGTPQELKDEGKKHQIKQVAHITSVEDAANAIYNGFALTVGSNYSFSSTRDQYGVAKRTPQGWAHAMAWVAVTTAADLMSQEGVDAYLDYGYDVEETLQGEVPTNLKPKAADDPFFLVVNSWGKWNSGPKGKYDIPEGSFWISADVAEGMIRQQQAFALGNFDGFDPLPVDDWGFEPWLGVRDVKMNVLEPASYIIDN